MGIDLNGYGLWPYLMYVVGPPVLLAVFVATMLILLYREFKRGRRARQEGRPEVGQNPPR